MTAGSSLTGGRQVVAGHYRVTTSLLRFDTSGLPDGATITSASLVVRVNAKADGDNRSLVGEWYPASSWPIDAGDYSSNAGSSALAGADITGIATGQVNTFVLQNVSSVSTTGYTALRLGVSGGQPAADNYVQMASYESSLPEPQLVVSWETGPPTPPSTPPSNSALPVVSGSAVVGGVLSGSDGSWSGSAPLSFARQWRRCDAAGAGCVDIAGATGSSYTLVADSFTCSS